MTGEVPPDDELAADDNELDTGAANDELDDNEGLAREDAEPRRDADKPEDSGPPAAPAPFRETRASQRVSGPTRSAVVSDAKARAAVAGDDEIPYIDDPVSKIWVGAIVAIFILILLYGLLFGRAGMFSPAPPTAPPQPTDTPVPAVTRAPSASPSIRPSATITTSPSVAASPSLAPSPPGGTFAPTFTPGASPTP